MELFPFMCPLGLFFLLTIGSTSAQVNIIVLVSTSTLPPLTTTAVVNAPTSVPASFDYVLLGCYNELPANAGGRAVGLTGKYISPAKAIPEAMTVPLCLESCLESLASDGSGHFKYAALENTRECFCGQTLSNGSTIRDPAYCNYPCSGNVTTTCGGYGHLDLYQLKFTIISPTQKSTNSTNTTSPASSSTNTNTSSSNNGVSKNVGMWVGIGIGILVLILLVAFLLIWRKRRSQSHHPVDPPPYTPKTQTSPTTPSKLAFLPFVGAWGTRRKLKEEQERNINENRNGYMGDGDIDWNTTLGEGSTLHNTIASTERPSSPRDSQWPLGPESRVSEKGMPRERRNTLERWKSGVVPSPVMMGDTLSDSTATEMQGARGDSVSRAASAGGSAVSALGMSYLGDGDVSHRRAELPGSERESRRLSDRGLRRTSETVPEEMAELESPMVDSTNYDDIDTADLERKW